MTQQNLYAHKQMIQTTVLLNLDVQDVNTKMDVSIAQVLVTMAASLLVLLHQNMSLIYVSQEVIHQMTLTCVEQKI